MVRRHLKVEMPNWTFYVYFFPKWDKEVAYKAWALMDACMRRWVGLGVWESASNVSIQTGW